MQARVAVLSGTSAREIHDRNSRTSSTERASRDRWSYLRSGIGYDAQLAANNESRERLSGYEEFSALVKDLRLRRARNWKAEDSREWRDHKFEVAPKATHSKEI